MNSQEDRGSGELPPSFPPEGGKDRPRKKYTASDRRALYRAWQSSGEPAREFAARHGGVTAASLQAWRRRVLDGDDALEDARNPRNARGRSRGRYEAEERRSIVEAFERSGLGQRAFAATWGVAVNTLGKWLSRYREEGPRGLEPRPPGRRKGDGRRKIAAAVQSEIVRVRERHPEFGLRRVRDFLWRFRAMKVSAGGVRNVLDRAGVPRAPLVVKRRRKPSQPRRFERASPMQLWQTDITQFLLTRESRRVYLTVFLDDRSRFVVSHSLQLHQRSELVIEALLDGIQRYGKPAEVLTDQGRQYYAWRGKSDFERLLEREGIEHAVARAHHPETVGKCERLWETIDREFWSRVRPQELSEARERLSHWLAHYNFFRPHQGIDGLVPADRFFGAESAVRRAIEGQLSKQELSLALSEKPRRSVFLIGQIGDRELSLTGERGRLVLHTSDGERREIGLDEIGMPQVGKEQRDGRRDERNERTLEAPRDAAPHAARGETDPPEERAEAGDGGEGLVGAGECGGQGASAAPGDGDPGALAGSQVEGGAGGGTVDAAPARVADVADGVFGAARRALEAAAELERCPAAGTGGARGGVAAAQGAGGGALGAGAGATADERAEAARFGEGLDLDVADDVRAERKKKGDSD
ncbi:MAG: DDE-type integrase/transposase/recombinase [Planctomycetes bacterium]|nr:DDE-type integrase/transposase/recombinase [Planctomycetota bacterium]